MTSSRLSPMALLGVGYMGGSLALAARRAGVCEEVVGYDADPGASAVARRRGIADRMAGSAAEAVAGAPVRVLGGLAVAVAGAVEPDAVVLDIGSVKGPVVAAIEATPLGGRYVGCHPLAGTEAAGAAAADETLYAGKPCFVCPGPRGRP